MIIYDAMINIAAEVLVLSNAVFARWIDMPENASGPLDPNITLTQAGTDLTGYIASSVVHASDIICVIVDTLF